MTSLKIIIISRNCYPTVGPRAHRSTELAKKLVRMGHKVTIYALLGNFNYDNYSKETGITFKTLGVSKLGVKDNTNYYNRSFLAKGIRRLFSKLLEVPNIELIPMVKKALKKECEIDYLITIAQPHTIHWGAASYISKYNNKIKFWVADCGDPFMKNPFDSHPIYFAKFEKKWGKLCNHIIVPIEEAKKAYYKEFKGKIEIIPQGFDFEDVKLHDYSPNSKPVFSYSGIVYENHRDPSLFLDYLSELDYDFKFIVYTKPNKLFDAYKGKLGSKLEIRSYIPREELLYELSKMDFLINIKNSSGVQQPSKLIDYALTDRPILEITSSFLEASKFNDFINGDYGNKLIIKNIENYNIANVAKKFIELYNKSS